MDCTCGFNTSVIQQCGRIKNCPKGGILNLLAGINISAEQLMRSILVIAHGKKDLVDKIFDKNFYNDPRDVLMEAMDIDNTINYGLNTLVIPRLCRGITKSLTFPGI
ncbi:MAG: hypothetical protein LBK44_02790 [Spirochaetales bacterium]|jgi:hypothetical protein|nr:hypothetical protein [Spirochaetales bacterium]